jgi:ribosomal protein S25
MAGSDQSKQARKQQERLVPGLMAATSRVSKVVGSVGSTQSRKVEQRASPSKQGTRGPASTRRTQGSGKSSKAGTKKGPSSRRAAPAPTPVPTMPKAPADSRAISKARDAWGNLEPHHQQRILSLLLLGLSILLFASLTVFRNAPLLRALHGAFLALFGWSAYLLAIGLIVFAIAHLIEGIRNQKFIRWPFVIGLVLLWLIVLAESQLIAGSQHAISGVLGKLLIYPLLGWPAPIGHILLIGLFCIVSILTFGITLGHILFVGRTIGHAFPSNQGSGTATNTMPGPSPYRGQRPRFSRYGQTTPSPLPPRSQGLDSPLKEDDEDDAIEFQADFDDEYDDPRNDINLHKQEVGSVPRGARSMPPWDANEHSNAVQGAQQQALPFNASDKKPVTRFPTMPQLAPNPLKGELPKAASRTAAVPAVANPVNISPWKMAETTLLNHPEEVKLHMLGDDTNGLAKIIQDTLRSFRVDAEVRPEDISIGPTVIRFGIRPTGKAEMKKDENGRLIPIKDAGGNIVYESRTRVSRIMALQNDLALVLEAKTIRMEAPVPGRPYVGVEIPNKNSRLVTLREVLESKEYQLAKAKSKLAVALGKDVAGIVRVGDLARMPHLLIAGATGAGKSVMINTIIASMLTQATPDDVRLLMVDPKMVELNMYSGIPHLLAPVVIDVEKVVPLLRNAINEMEKRYRLFSQLGVRNLDGYRKMRAERLLHGDSSLQNLPAIVIIIDELADLMMAAPEEVEGMICRLAQLARATGIHLVIATQRPSVDVITGLIKANIPTRISFMVSSAVDSRTIIDMGGAERLLGRGDMLYLPADAGRPERIQGAFLADEEAERLVAYWRQQALEHAAATNTGNGNGNGNIVGPTNISALQQSAEPGWELRGEDSDDFELDDNLVDRAEEVVREYGRASISLLQRRLHISYSRAARLIDLLEEHGIIGHAEGNGRSREILEEGNGSRNGNGGYAEGRTMADEAADIVAEEKAREEFLKKHGQHNDLAQGGEEEDE